MRSNLLPIALLAALLLTAALFVLEYDILMHHARRSLDALIYEIEWTLGLATVLVLSLFVVWYRRSRAHRLELERRLAAETKAREALELALLDPLTGLANRRQFCEILNAAAGNDAATRHALFLLDLDDFKPVNDTFGHPVGDEVLRIVSDRLRHAVKARDLVSRLGGDEFSTIVFDIGTVEAAEDVARRLQETVARPIEVSGHEVHVSASVGFTLFPEAGRKAADIYARADDALYRAKANKDRHAPVCA